MLTGTLLPRRRAVVVTVVALLSALVATGVLAARASANLSPCERHAAASEARARQVTGSGDRILVVGDSWSVGLGLDAPVQSWPSRLPLRVHVAGFSGSGFSAKASRCGRVSFADRTPAALRSRPELVVLQGGLNDVDRSRAEIRSGFERALRATDERSVVVVGPALAPARARAVPRVDRLLRHLSSKHGVPYISTTDLELSYLEDRLHLTAAGHREFGDAVAERVLALFGSGRT